MVLTWIAAEIGKRQYDDGKTRARFRRHHAAWSSRGLPRNLDCVGMHWPSNVLEPVLACIIEGNLGLASYVLLNASRNVDAARFRYPFQTYRYVYSITNNAATGSAAIQLFDILFDTSLYQESSLQIVTPAPLHTQWSEQLLSSAPSVPAAYDALSLTGGIAAGSTVTGFSVQFTWLGTGTPGPQPFQVFDPNTFAVLQSGVTSTLPVGVPAASTLTLFLLGVGLSLAAAFQMRERLAGRT